MTTAKRWLVATIVFALMGGVLAGPVAAPAAAVDPADARIDLKVLVITDSSGTSPSFEAWTELLDREGVPYDVHTAGTDPVLSSSNLASGDRAYYQGVVCATRCSIHLGIGTPAATALESFLADFDLRRINGYAFPFTDLGLTSVGGGDVGGDELAITPAGDAVFPYLDGTVPIDEFTFGYYPAVADPARFTVLAEGPGASAVLGIYDNALGFEEMVMTVDGNQFQLQSLLLGHGMVNWLTKGLYLGYSRNYFAGHFDDVFLEDDRWDVDANSDQTGLPGIRMAASDVTRALSWQSTNGIRLDMVYNGFGSDDAIATNGTDPLTDAFLAVRDQFYWINHTYEHKNLDNQPGSGYPPITQAEIIAEINDNIVWATANDITIDMTELVTGQHSGLGNDIFGIPPNPDLPGALTATGILWTAADNSVQPDPYDVGSARTIPRYPANVFYNTGTMEEQLDEYNWIYVDVDAEPPGSCDPADPPPATTCLAAPLTWDEYVDTEASIMLPHLITNDPRPHYFHQSDLAEDGLFYIVFGEVLSRYRSYFDVDLVQPLFTGSGEIMERKENWDDVKNSVDAYVQRGAVFLTSPAGSVDAPITGTPIGSPYWDGLNSGWLTISSSQTVLDWTPPEISLVGDDPQTIVFGDSYVELGATATDNVDGDLTASIVIDPTGVDLANPGSYQVTYNVTDAAGNAAVEVTRTVNVVDTVPPAQVIDSPADLATVPSPATLAGTATDNAGIASVEITITDPVTGDWWNGSGWQSAPIVLLADVSLPNATLTGWSYVFDLGSGTPSALPYQWTARAIDTAGNSAVLESTSHFSILDETPPAITLTGPDPQTIEVGAPYVELGAMATDDVDGDISASIVIDDTDVDTTTLGSYDVRYNVSDAAGNPAPEVTRTVDVVDTTPPVLSIDGDNPQFVEAGEAYVEQGATAVDNYDGDISESVIINANGVNTDIPGTYFVTYRSIDSSGNEAGPLSRRVDVADTLAPSITLVGDNPQIIDIGDSYVELGATAEDAFEGDLTGAIDIDASAVDTNAIGSYDVVYTVADSAGNDAQVMRMVQVVDPDGPVIILEGANPQVIERGDPYVELGATAFDDVDGDLTESIVIDASGVDTNAVGAYEVTYNVSDSSGNAAPEVVRTVQVIDVTPPVIALIGANPQQIRLMDPYVELGATATDDVDGDVSGAMVIDASAVDTNAVGAYEVTYNVSDSSGNAALEVVRTVEVVDPFPDVPSGAWYYDYVIAMFLAGWVDGFPDGTFRPDSPVTRAEVAKFVIDALGEAPTTPTSDPFPDVPSGHWAAGYIERLVQLGILQGFPDGTFHPDESASRAEIAKMVIEALGDAPTIPASDPFPDVPSDHWAAGYIERLVQLGIVEGFPDGTFRPDEQVTRAQIAKIVTEAFLP